MVKSLSGEQWGPRFIVICDVYITYQGLQSVALPCSTNLHGDTRLNMIFRDQLVVMWLTKQTPNSFQCPFLVCWSLIHDSLNSISYANNTISPRKSHLKNFFISISFVSIPEARFEKKISILSNSIQIYKHIAEAQIRKIISISQPQVGFTLCL